jgi:hypothetical protein
MLRAASHRAKLSRIGSNVAPAQTLFQRHARGLNNDIFDICAVSMKYIQLRDAGNLSIAIVRYNAGLFLNVGHQPNVARSGQHTPKVYHAASPSRLRPRHSPSGV